MNHSARRVNALAAALGARRYLEIGVGGGTTFRDVAIAERIGVDPGLGFDPPASPDAFTRYVAQSSDAFFVAEPLFPAYDIIFIDGLHTFEQVVRDFANALMHAHHRTAILLDDTVPSDVYSAIPDASAMKRFRKAAYSESEDWHGDVFKAVFYIHDFWPSLNYRTITGSGNPQTLVWRAKNVRRRLLFNDLERISRLTYFDLQDHLGVLRMVSEDEAITLCVAEINALDLRSM